MTITQPAERERRPGALARLFGFQTIQPVDLPEVEPEVVSVPARERESGDRGIVASARRLTDKDIKSRNTDAQGGAGKTPEWQEESWELNDLIGEQRFLSNTIANRLSQAALYVGKLDMNASPGTRPEQAEAELQSVLNAIGDGPVGLGQILHRLGVNLFVAGEGWLVGIPPRLVPGTPEHKAATDMVGQQVVVDRAAEENEGDDVLSLVWRMLSVSEVSVDQSAVAKIKLESGLPIEAPVSSLYMVRIWRPHPRRAWEADSPTRASLPVLRELLGLTMHVSAQIDSRLAGAGLLLFSSSADAALKQAAGIDPTDSRSPLMEALQEAMETAIKDRSSAAALVPITVTVPDEVVDKVKHLTFSSSLDKEAVKLREESIRRLALGQDAPPELLLGTGGMNHWGAWLVREDVVQTHLEPPLALICDALTTQYLRPVLIGMGKSPEEAAKYVVWYDVDHLIERPSRSQDAKDLYAAGVINDKALRDACGFEDGDAPDEPAITDTDPAVELAMRLVVGAPSLVQNPGLPALVEQIRAVLDGEKATEAAAAMPVEVTEEIVEGESGGETATEGTVPDTQGDLPPVGTPGNPSGGAA